MYCDRDVDVLGLLRRRVCNGNNVYSEAGVVAAIGQGEGVGAGRTSHRGGGGGENP